MEHRPYILLGGRLRKTEVMIDQKSLLAIVGFVGLCGCRAHILDGGTSDSRSTANASREIYASEFESPAGLPKGVVRIGNHTFKVEIAATARSRAQGLMARQTLARDAGMLFVYDYPQAASFWMLNTPIPLDVAFIREDLAIASISVMEPFSTETNVSTEPVRYALEVAAGEFARRGIAAGDTVVISGVE